MIASTVTGSEIKLLKTGLKSILLKLGFVFVSSLSCLNTAALLSFGKNCASSTAAPILAPIPKAITAPVNPSFRSEFSPSMCWFTITFENSSTPSPNAIFDGFITWRIICFCASGNFANIAPTKNSATDAGNAASDPNFAANSGLAPCAVNRAMFSSVCTPDACNSSPPTSAHFIDTGVPILASDFITTPAIKRSSVSSFAAAHVKLNGLVTYHSPSFPTLFHNPSALSI